MLDRACALDSTDQNEFVPRGNAHSSAKSSRIHRRGVLPAGASQFARSFEESVQMRFPAPMVRSPRTRTRSDGAFLVGRLVLESQERIQCVYLLHFKP